MTSEQKKAIDACKDQAAGEHLNNDGFPFLTYKEARQQVTGFINDEIVDRAMQLYGEQCAQHASHKGQEAVDLEFEREQAYQSGFVDAAKGNPSKYGGTACRDCGNTEYCNTHCSHRK